MKDDGDNNDANGDSDTVTTGITALWLVNKFQILVMMLAMFFVIMLVMLVIKVMIHTIDRC